MCRNACVVVRRYLRRSVLSLHQMGPGDMNSGHRACWQVFLATERFTGSSNLNVKRHPETYVPASIVQAVEVRNTKFLSICMGMEMDTQRV